MKKISELKTFLVSARKLINKLPKYNSKFSNKIYDNHQKMIILVFRQKMRMTYRGIVGFLRFSGVARALLNLKRVPDHSTLVKFHKRIKESNRIVEVEKLRFLKNNEEEMVCEVN